MLQVVCSPQRNVQELVGFLMARCNVSVKSFNSIKPYTRNQPTIIIGSQYGSVFEALTNEQPEHGKIKNNCLYVNDIKQLLRVPALVPQYERLIRQFITPVIEPDYSFTNIADTEQLDIALGKFTYDAPIAFDIETNGLYWQQADTRILCIVLAQLGQYTRSGQVEAICIDGTFLHSKLMNSHSLRWFFKRCTCLIAHNAAFDTTWLDALLHITAQARYDTMLMAFNVQNSVYRYSNGLKQLTELYFNVPDYGAQIKPYYTGKNKGMGFANVPYIMLADYAVKDVVYTALLYERLKPHTCDKQYQALYHSRYEIYTRLNRTGMGIDWWLTQQYKQWLTTIKLLHLRAIKKEVGKDLNPHSPKQLKEYLYGELKLPVQYGKNKKVTTNNLALQNLIDKNELPVLTLLGQYRKVSKVLGTYIAGIERLSNIGHTKMHETFKLTATVSGRIGSEVLLLLPRAYSVWGQIVKSCLQARPGFKFVNIDVSQLEVRVLAYLSQDEALIQAYEQGQDIHSNTARLIYGEDFTKQNRTDGKAAMFGYVYGASAMSLVYSNKMSIENARDLIAGFETAYSGVVKWVARVHERALSQGYIENEMGRRLDLGLITDKNVKNILRLAQNWLVQSFGSDIVQLAVQELVQKGAPIVLTVHDSIVLEVKQQELEYWIKQTVETMERYGNQWLASTCDYPKAVPYKVDVDAPCERLAEPVSYEQIKDVLLYDELWYQMISQDEEDFNE